jgi:hypothetical protein
MRVVTTQDAHRCHVGGGCTFKNKHGEMLNFQGRRKIIAKNLVNKEKHYIFAAENEV